ncbi:MAG: hypothetical protein Q9228_001858 [Teloschistes exilis]
MALDFMVTEMQWSYANNIQSLWVPIYQDLVDRSNGKECPQILEERWLYERRYSRGRPYAGGLYDVRLQSTRQDPMTLEQPNPSSNSYSRSLIGGQRLDPDPMRRQVQYDDVQVPRHGRRDFLGGPQPVQHADEGRKLREQERAASGSLRI